MCSSDLVGLAAAVKLVRMGENKRRQGGPDRSGELFQEELWFIIMRGKF